jgi:hypothetical protein
MQADEYEKKAEPPYGGGSALMIDFQPLANLRGN